MLQLPAMNMGEKFKTVTLRDFWYNPLDHTVSVIVKVSGATMPVEVAVSKNPSPEELMEAVNLLLSEAEYVSR